MTEPRILPLLAAASLGCSGSGLEPIPVTLTFDDGPVDAHVPRAEAPGRDAAALLAPLDAVLAELSRRGARAVFYLEGPGSEDAVRSLRQVHGDGIARIAERGHVLGFHAFDHDPALWAALSDADARAIEADLDSLAGFLDDVAPGSTTPVFRPPFGGPGAAGAAGRAAAGARGWTVHGFRIDAVDWTANATADAGLVAMLPVACEASALTYARRRLAAGAARTAGDESVDVLFHVNAFTGAHLGALLDALTDAYRDHGREAVFQVPDAYLEADDTFADLSFLGDRGQGAPDPCR